MNVSCPECQSVFRVDPAKLPADGVRARCSVCGGVIMVPAPASVAGESVAAESAAPAPTNVLTTPPMPSPAVATPAMPSAGIAPDPRAPEPRAPEPRAPTPAQPAAAQSTPDAVPPPPSAPPAAGVRADADVDPSSGAARRPINPFIANDPGQKARRLARALVSDIVAYHPQKREEGMRTGALKQLFRDEIKKSYEEYVEQVGQQLAESTPHFQDALNDVLAGGRKVF